MSSRRSCESTTSEWYRDGCPQTTSRRGTLASAEGRQCLPLGEGSYLEAFLGDGEFVLTSRRGTHSGADTAPQLKARGGPYPHPKTRADTDCRDVCFFVPSPSRRPLLVFADKGSPDFPRSSPDLPRSSRTSPERLTFLAGKLRHLHFGWVGPLEFVPRRAR